MKTSDKKDKNTHHGHAVKRFRHTLGIKQDALATELGISQAMISMYESKKVIEDEMIEKFATALGVSSKIIKDLEEDPVTVIVENNTFQKGSVGTIAPYGDIENFGNTYNPVAEILKLSQEKQALYERMLKLEQEKVALLEKLLKDKQG